MRASDLLGATVIDTDGRRRGDIADLRLDWDGPGGEIRLAGVVVDDGRLARFALASGALSGRLDRPALLVRLLRRAARNAQFVAADDVEEWPPGAVRVRADAARLLAKGSE